ncbi:MAG: flagellar basal body protein [Desulfobacteraceae bacterium]|nr:flagellar basal body protein [Desulfobacteraceae bacterium]
MDSIRSALSGLLGFQKKMEATANNTANVDTEGYKKVRVDLADDAAGGVTASSQTIETPGPLVKEPTSNGFESVELSNVDLGEEIPNELLTRRFYEANLKSIQTADEMLGSLIDIKR